MLIGGPLHPPGSVHSARSIALFITQLISGRRVGKPPRRLSAGRSREAANGPRSHHSTQRGVDANAEDRQHRAATRPPCWRDQLLSPWPWRSVHRQQLPTGDEFLNVAGIHKAVWCLHGEQEPAHAKNFAGVDDARRLLVTGAQSGLAPAKPDGTPGSSWRKT